MIDNNNTIEKAVAFAAEAFQGKTSGPSNTPLLLQALESVLVMSELDNADPTMMTVAALNRITDHTDMTFDDIEDAFGSRIRGMLFTAHIAVPEDFSCDEAFRECKQKEIEALRRLPFKLKMVTLADKIADLRMLKREYEVYRDELWNRLPQKNTKLLAEYYFGMGDIFFEFEEYPAYSEYNRLAAVLFRNFR